MGAPGGARQQRCTACGSGNSVPEGPSGPLALFKCGWCAALNNLAAEGSSPTTPDPAAPRLVMDKPRRCRRPLGPTVAGYVIVAIVLLVVGSIFVLGISLVLPTLFGPAASAMVHTPLAALLAFNILFNYAACVLRPAGPVQRYLQQAALDASGRVRRGALDGCRYCHRCCYYKPATAHHCRSCNCCVVELDHHCWYINNCTGAANLRNFLLFLTWLLAGVAYGLALGLLMGWRDRRALWQHTLRVLQGTSHMNPVLRMLSFSLTWLLWAPQWLACWAYFTMVCWATLVSVGLLFRRQVGLLRQGQTYLDTLSQQQQQQQDEQAAPTAPPAAPTATAAEAPMPSSALATPAALPLPAMLPAMHHVRHVFGGRHPLTWLLPAWEVPPAEAGRRAKVS